MPDLPADVPEPAAGSPHLDLPLVREFNNRSSLWLLGDPENLRGLLQILDSPLVERLDFAHARRINRGFVPADLQEKESDVVYAVPFRGMGGRGVWVYVLLEHQSEPGRARAAGPGPGGGPAVEVWRARKDNDDGTDNRGAAQGGRPGGRPG
jgi:putative YhgA-like transposase